MLGSNQLTGAVPTSLTTRFPLTSSTWTANCLTGVSQQYSGCSLVERQPLVELYTATNGTGWTSRVNWLTSGHPCVWEFVQCVSSSGPVNALLLANNGLAGTIPTSIGAIVTLTDLTLGSNPLTGSIPTTIGALTGLTYVQVASPQCRVAWEAVQ